MPHGACHAPSWHMLPQFSQRISMNSFRAAQGGRPDLQGPLVAELKDQPAAGAPPCWDTGPTSPQPPVTSRDCSCMGGTSLVPHCRLRLQQVSCLPCFQGLWAQRCAATSPGLSCLVISHEALIVMLLGNLQRHGIAALGCDGQAHGWKPRADLAMAAPMSVLFPLAGAGAVSQLKRVGLVSSTMQPIPQQCVPHK